MKRERERERECQIRKTKNMRVSGLLHVHWLKCNTLPKSKPNLCILIKFFICLKKDVWYFYCHQISHVFQAEIASHLEAQTFHSKKP